MNKIIVMDEDFDKEININLYTFIEQLYKADIPFVVCHVTEKEYSKMWQQVSKTRILNERLSGSDDYGYNRNRYLIGNNIKEKILEIADYNDLHKKGSYFIKDNEIVFDENAWQFTNNPLGLGYSGISFLGKRIYTTETFDDVINHYQLIKELTSSLDSIISKIYTNPESFYKVVYDTLSSEDKAYIISKISNKSCLNCLNNNCLKRDNSSNVFDHCIDWNNSVLIAKTKILNLKK